jgi:hypothetical protein
MPGVRLRSEGRFIAAIGRKLLGLSQAIAPGRTYAVAGSESTHLMSAFGDRVDIGRTHLNVCFWHKTDIQLSAGNVRFWG